MTMSWLAVMSVCWALASLTSSSPIHGATTSGNPATGDNSVASAPNLHPIPSSTDIDELSSRQQQQNSYGRGSGPVQRCGPYGCVEVASGGAVRCDQYGCSSAGAGGPGNGGSTGAICDQWGNCRGGGSPGRQQGSGSGASCGPLGCTGGSGGHDQLGSGGQQQGGSSSCGPFGCTARGRGASGCGVNGCISTR